MNDEKWKALEAAGWKFGNAEDFFKEIIVNFDAAVRDSITIARSLTARSEDYQNAACVLAAEVERLRGELSTEGTAGELILQDNKDLRIENKRLRAACNKYSEDELLQGDWKARALKAETELAAAKAASVCPVQVVYFEPDYERTVTVKLWTNADGQLFADWLRDRIKKRDEQ